MQMWVTVALRVFFKNTLVNGLENVSKDKAVIYCGNHQNAFLDALLIAVLTNTQPHSLTRADIYKNPVAARLLATLRMMPVYRIRDGRDAMDKNEEIFEACQALLSRNESLIVFPEGNHGEQRKLRVLKKGVARIAISTLEKYPDRELYIQPLGLNYSHHSKFRSNVVVEFGEPIPVHDWLNGIKSRDERILQRDLTSLMFKRIQALTLHINNDEKYASIDKFTKELHPLNQLDRPSLANDYHQLKGLIEALNGKSDMKHHDSLLEAQELLNRTNTAGVGAGHQSDWMALIVLCIPAVLGIGYFYVPHQIVSKRVPKLIKDPQFRGSMKVALGLIIFPLWVMVLAIPIGLFLGGAGVGVYLLVVALIAYITLHWIDVYNDYCYHKQFERGKAEHPQKFQKLTELVKKMKQ